MKQKPFGQVKSAATANFPPTGILVLSAERSCNPFQPVSGKQQGLKAVQNPAGGIKAANRNETIHPLKAQSK